MCWTVCDVWADVTESTVRLVRVILSVFVRRSVPCLCCFRVLFLEGTIYLHFKFSSPAQFLTKSWINYCCLVLSNSSGLLKCFVCFLFWKPQFNYITNLVEGKIKSHVMWNQQTITKIMLRSPVNKILDAPLFSRNLVCAGWIQNLSQ